MIDRTSQTPQWRLRRIGGTYINGPLTETQVHELILHSVISVNNTEVMNVREMAWSTLGFRPPSWMPVRDVAELYPPQMLYTLKVIAPKMKWLHNAYEMRIPQ